MMYDSTDRPQRPSLLTANLWYLLASGGLLLISAIALLLVRLPVFDAHRQTLSSFLNAFYEICLLALPALLFALKSRSAARSFRLNRPDVRMLLYAAGLAAIGVLMANFLTTWWLLLIDLLGGMPQESGIPIPSTPGELSFSILLIGVIPGVCEEMLFRGGVMSAWERFGQRTALIVSSVLFALLHGTIAGLPNQIIMGLILGSIVLLSDSIYVSMLYHAVHNSLTMLLAYFSLKAMPDGTAAEIPADLSASMGGAAGYASLLISTAVMIAVFVMLFQSMRDYAKRRRLNAAPAETSAETVPAPALLTPPVPRFIEFLPLILSFFIITFNYTADFIATFCS